MLPAGDKDVQTYTTGITFRTEFFLFFRLSLISLDAQDFSAVAACAVSWSWMQFCSPERNTKNLYVVSLYTVNNLRSFQHRHSWRHKLHVFSYCASEVVILRAVVQVGCGGCWMIEMSRCGASLLPEAICSALVTLKGQHKAPSGRSHSAGITIQRQHCLLLLGTPGDRITFYTELWGGHEKATFLRAVLRKPMEHFTISKPIIRKAFLLSLTKRERHLKCGACDRSCCGDTHLPPTVRDTAQPMPMGADTGWSHEPGWIPPSLSGPQFLVFIMTWIDIFHYVQSPSAPSDIHHSCQLCFSKLLPD